MSNLKLGFYRHFVTRSLAPSNTRAKTQQAGYFWGVGALALSCLGVIPQSVQADACQPQWIANPVAVPALKGDDQATHLEADTLTQPNSNVLELHGQARIAQPGSVLLADEVRYQKAEQQADAFGQVQLHRDDLLLTASQAHLDNQAQTVQLDNTRYQIKQNRAHGQAKTIQLHKTREIADLNHATLTTCPLETIKTGIQPDNKRKVGEDVAWELEFAELQINNQTRRVVGHNTVLFFKGVPVFYTPYFDFPLDDRATGLLIPEFGGYKALTEERSSFYVKLPYYFNLAPHYDDTLSLMYMENRGAIVENEFRYLLNTRGVRHGAEFTVSLLNDAKTADEGLAYIDTNGDIYYGEKIAQRWRGKLLANQQWNPHLRSEIVWHEASDENFFADIPVESTFKNLTTTPRWARIDYSRQNWQAYAQVYSYLRLRDAAINYEKRPEIGLRYRERFGNLNLNLVTEATEFDIPLSDPQKPEALRTRLAPELSVSLRRPWGHLKATAIANGLNYALHDNGYNTTGQDQIQHTVMQYALQGGLVFERDWQFGQNRYIQTLEPTLQYLHVPYVNQSQVPLFDTTTKSLDFSNLYALNRFSGYDRIGDTTQISAALTSKLLTADGAPFLEAGIGQIYYLADRKVALGNDVLDTTTESDYFAKLAMTGGDLAFSSTSQFDKTDLQLVNTNSRVHWQLSDKNRVLLNYLLSNNNLPTEQATLGAGGTVRLNQHWELGAYWNYDFTHEVRNEVQYAARYDDCCWAAEFMLEETQLENGLYNYSLQFMIEFKGLSTSGQRFKEYLNNRLNF